jgi:Alpha-N-acetylglucosaminidase (NAGLU) tim-barrel domain/Alpha-N-acetylglucosaminidase (NAGLU) C-terminal domain/Glycosyl hydrolases family 35/Alpha-N-acetylglucosaminidase (NAGLU) N-terminal domain
MKAKELSHKIRTIRQVRCTFVLAALLVQQVVAGQGGGVPKDGQLDQPALKAFLQRIVKDKASRFEIEYIAPEGGKDVFEVDQRPNKVGDQGRTLMPGHIVLRGSNGVSVASALNYYLKNYCHSLVTWNGSSLAFPAVLPQAALPQVGATVHKVTPYTYRYYLNYCTFQYSMAWWGWDRWQQEIDWMAMNGINMPLALTGEEAIWQEVYRSMGFTDGELDKFFSGPAYFSWLWMGNIDAWGGPLPAHWKESHRLLQKKILQAERTFGMKPVLPAFTGHVPPSFKERFPTAKVKKTNWDAGFPDVYILDPSDPLFEAIGKKFIEVQTREFGTDHLYSADTFNENVPPTSDSTYLDGMSKKVFASMAVADPAAVWVMQGWMFHYNAAYWKPTQIQALLKAVPDDHMILLDLYSESHPVWNRTEAYYGKPWIWNMLHNFGGNISLWGRMQHAAEDPSKALHDPAAGKMVGIGLTPEGIEQNPALYQLMLENVWQDEPVKVGDWLDAYVRERYSDAGMTEDARHLVREAWRLLEGSVYKGGLTEGGPESIIQARPTFEKAIDRVNTKLDYDPATLFKAWELFEQAAPVLGKSDGFQYDLTDIARQVLANYASPLQQNIAIAWQAKDTAAFRRYCRKFLVLMDDMDRLLATRRDFLLGKWIHEARACGITANEKDLYEKNARDLITLWGDKESGLREYSCRQWSGLIKGFYKPRWELFFHYLDKALAEGHEVDMAAFDKEVKNQEWKWVNSHELYSDQANGKTITVAGELFQKYSSSVRAATWGLSAAPGNDHIFPAAAAARPAINFDEKGFFIHGKRTFVVSAGMEYARVPHDLWRDRLLRLKRAGFNCIEIYTFWNFHEPMEGHFEFSGDHDLEAFLQLVGQLGLYAIVRVGPYYCAEWDNGGYPLWLRFKPGLQVREDNAVFETYADRFFDRLLPIVCRQQIHHGGPVILVQLENEHTAAWGTAMPNGYFRHLREKAVSLGLEVPYFFSGLHHGSDPAGEEVRDEDRGNVGEDNKRLDDPDRPNPWMSTEFWSVWYSGYGSTAKDSAVYDRRTWKILAHGGNGYNYYMAHGGSNFGYTNNDEDAASYDYSAAVGQAGDLRPIYYAFKRAAFFAHSFDDILENSVDETGAWKKYDFDTAVRVTARHSVAGDILFFDNLGDAPVSAVWRAGGYGPMPITLAAHEIFPLVHHFALMPGVKLDWAPVKVLAVTGEDHERTIIIDGDAGQAARLYFTTDGVANIVKGGDGLKVSGGRVSLEAVFPSAFGMPMQYSFRVGIDTVRILVMSRVMADRTWLPECGGRTYIVCGPAYLGEMKVQGGHFSMVTERALGSADGPVWVYRASGDGVTLRPQAAVAGAPGGNLQVKLEPWGQRRGNDEARPDYNDHDWLSSERPVQMGTDGDTTADAWYRTTIAVDSGGIYTLQATGGDRATIFVDGQVAGNGNLHTGELPLSLEKGNHALAIFTAEDGRDKLAGFLGDMSEVDSKGLVGSVVLQRGGSTRHELGGWWYIPATADDTVTGRMLPSEQVKGWKPYTIGQDVFDHQQGFAWMRAQLPDPPPGVSKAVLSFRSVDENATVFLNGRRLLRHEGWNMPFEVALGGLDTMRRPIVLTVLIENYSNEGGIDKPVQVNYLKNAKELTGWKMHGGIIDPTKITDWGILPPAADSNVGPYYYGTVFSVPVDTGVGAHYIWRVSTKGLGHGSVWVNGHNLGRYPEKIPAPGLYIPECWLKDGPNELIVYDEDGNRPDAVTVEPETAAGRYLTVYSNF